MELINELFEVASNPLIRIVEESENIAKEIRTYSLAHLCNLAKIHPLGMNLPYELKYLSLKAMESPLSSIKTHQREIEKFILAEQTKTPAQVQHTLPSHPEQSEDMLLEEERYRIFRYLQSSHNWENEVSTEFSNQKCRIPFMRTREHPDLELIFPNSKIKRNYNEARDSWCSSN